MTIRLSALLCLISSLSAYAAGSDVVVIPSGESNEQHLISGHPPGTRIRADGLVLYGGESDHFNPPPRFCLRSASKRDPENGVGYPDTNILEALELPNEELYPIQLRNLEDPSISGFSVIGLQSKELPWRIVKAMWDGDALHIKGCRGSVQVSDVYWENVEDGLGPNGGVNHWALERAWMKDIRDDAIENDSSVSGLISDCLVDGCFVFLSQRADDSIQKKSLTVIRNCYVRVSAQPHDGEKRRERRDRNIKFGNDGIGRAPGMIFKWDKGEGTVDVKDCVFVMEGMSINGPEDMAFPPGSYENVTLIWLGPGNYPSRLPFGVSQTNDITIWENAKRAWIDRLPESHPGLKRIQSTMPEP